ncbi:hypothetical protein CEP54_011664, partial [Fusarium duplospermum]
MSQEAEATEGRISDTLLSKTIKEYYEALHLYSLVLKFEEPAPRTTRALQKWLGEAGERPYQLEYPDNSETPYPDLISLYTPGEHDFLSRTIASSPLRWFFLDTRMSRKGEYYINEGALERFITVAGLAFAMLFMVGAMWTLWA